MRRRGGEDIRLILRVEVEGRIEIKGLDGERKALVYDNYSKLISATDTIRKVGRRKQAHPLPSSLATTQRS